MMRWKESLLNLFFPTANACHLCERALEGTQDCLCHRCALGLQACAILPIERETLVASRWRGLSAFWYQDQARELVHQLKYHSNLQAARPLGDQMALALVQSSLQGQADALVPVPLHPARLRQRGYNQAEILAREVSLHTGVPLCEAALFRRKNLGTQVRRTREERLQAMAHVFSASETVVGGKRLLLIDDVLTTGATADACLQALQQAGAEVLGVLTACRA